MAKQARGRASELQRRPNLLEMGGVLIHAPSANPAETEDGASLSQLNWRMGRVRPSVIGGGSVSPRFYEKVVRR